MTEEIKEKNPEIVGFACSYCTFKASEMAGSLRMKYPEVKLVKCRVRAGLIQLSH